ncbi:MAG: hypothetical protein AAFW64_04810 [Pseudomonadota bacterium]
MWRLMLISVLAASPVLAEPDMRVLVDREPSGISVYFTTPASDLQIVFGAGADELLTEAGTVDIDGLYQGTFDTADDIFADVTAQISGAPFAFEALSMMVHDPALLPDFATPYDAAMSVAVCNSPETVRNMSLEQLDAFLGFYAWKADPLADVELVFPATGRDALTVEIIDYAPSGDLRRSSVVLADGGALRLSAPAAQTRFASLAPLLAALAAVLAALGIAAYARRIV